jgi:hypothetical protein
LMPMMGPPSMIPKTSSLTKESFRFEITCQPSSSGEKRMMNIFQLALTSNNEDSHIQRKTIHMNALNPRIQLPSLLCANAADCGVDPWSLA